MPCKNSTGRQVNELAFDHDEGYTGPPGVESQICIRTEEFKVSLNFSGPFVCALRCPGIALAGHEEWAHCHCNFIPEQHLTIQD